jgi:leucyl-tRNA synthetase
VNEVAASDSRDGEATGELARAAHHAIAQVSDDLGRRSSFNTAIARVMELVNELSKDTSAPGARFAAETAVGLIQPYEPHVAEELWQRLGPERLWEQPWPEANPALLAREDWELVIQVDGKVRDRVRVSGEPSRDELLELAKASPKVQAHLNGRSIRQAIVVPRKLVNLVVG